MLSGTFIIFAAIINAMMDRLENETFFNSIFKDWNQKFWYKRVSWEHAKVIFNYKIDGWHLCKSTMLILIMAAIVCYKPVTIWQVDFIFLGILWNVIFEFFYSSVFKIP